METVYVETTIVSYLVASPSRDLMLAAHQQATHQWWAIERLRYRCVTSEEVLREAAYGDPEMSRRRLAALAGMAVLPADATVRQLAKDILIEQLLPASVISDAIHVAAASLHDVDYLLTWNCRHLANPHLHKPLRSFMTARRLALPEICTPIELAGE